MYSFSYLEPVCCSMSSSNCCFLTRLQISQEAGQVAWYSHLFQNFAQFIVIHTVKVFGIVNKAPATAAKSLQLCPTVQPYRRQPTRLPCPWDYPGKNTGVGCHFLLQGMKVKSESEVAQSSPTLSDPMDFSPPGSSIHGVSRQEYWSGVPLPWC